MTQHPFPPLPDSLDELLEYAFRHKEQKQDNQALAAFRYIRQWFPDSDAALMATIEIVTLLKDRGAYDEAIQVMGDAKTLSCVQKDPPLAEEIINTVAYLRIVKNVLLHRYHSLYPYRQIPTDARQEIDEQFREWRALS